MTFLVMSIGSKTLRLVELSETESRFFQSLPHTLRVLLSHNGRTVIATLHDMDGSRFVQEIEQQRGT